MEKYVKILPTLLALFGFKAFYVVSLYEGRITLQGKFDSATNKKCADIKGLSLCHEINENGYIDWSGTIELPVGDGDLIDQFSVNITLT